jgi:hypothetical protein
VDDDDGVAGVRWPHDLDLAFRDDKERDGGLPDFDEGLTAPDLSRSAVLADARDLGRRQDRKRLLRSCVSG